MKSASIIAIPLLLTVTTLAKEKRHRPPEAPPPDQIGKAKSISLLSRTESLFYDEAYKQLKDWGRFDLVSDPDKADLILV